MAITSSAKRAIKVAARKRVFNLRRQRAMHLAVREVSDLVVEKKVKEAQTKLPAAFKAIDKAAKRGVIKANNAARKKSRLSRLVASSLK